MKRNRLEYHLELVCVFVCMFVSFSLYLMYFFLTYFLIAEVECIAAAAINNFKLIFSSFGKCGNM